MPLPVLKENATQEEKNQWIIDTQAEYKRLEDEKTIIDKKVSDTDKRVSELESANQKLFLKVTSKVEDVKKNEVIPSFISKELYETLSDKEKEMAQIIEKGEDE